MTIAERKTSPPCAGRIDAAPCRLAHDHDGECQPRLFGAEAQAAYDAELGGL